MAKVLAPFKISGTLDDINFVVTEDGNNYARLKGKTGVTKEEFKNNPIFDRIRNHGKEWGYCSKKSQSFRQVAAQLFRKAKDGSFAGRSIKLLSEILEEDTVNPKGARTLEEGLKSEHIPEILIGFEGNKNCPLHQTLKTVFEYLPDKNTIRIKDFKPENHIKWPSDEATHVQLQMATADWDPVNEGFTTNYSEEVTFKKCHNGTVTLQTEIPNGNNWKISFLFIGFAIQERRKLKPLHRKNNTITIITCFKA
ncbi:hypothetical protein FSS13T_22400 [Flavobacterium saliperosum S13]|uniref:Uncharacterized protein n=2 Tax=Flavobacterium saliperosum TaxID=329186 RepID=A0A1G4VPC5_9FLAO|nr:hypothetical protein [Flavobacterium saliperosum]ESU23932.1 hypothetical protein FSS13T_22400 [Flavobacterium saliperosum S13]SCX09825.1 hypothetical protein SAMN02927925_01454 [Flavobacterium saliperosum]